MILLKVVRTFRSASVVPLLIGAALLTVTATAQRGRQAPTLVITNGKVLNADGTFSEAIAMAATQILRVGSTRDISALQSPATRVIDARGRAVVPGFIDSHVHFMIGGESLEQVNLRGTRTQEEARERLKAFVASHKEAAWIRGANGYGRLTGADLDEIIPDRPAFIVSGDVHSLLANKRALAAAGVTRTTADPPNGKIVRDEKTGEATGLMLEAAQGLVTRAVPAPTQEERRRTLKAAMDEAHRSGVTSIVNIGGPDDIALFDEARRTGNLSVRIYSALWVAPGGGDSAFPVSVNATDADLDHFEEIQRQYRNDDLLKVGAIKIMLDGVIESRTAAMLEPYLDVNSKGTPTLPPERLRQIVTRMDRSGWQIITHALGDGAIRLALDTYEAAERANPAPPQGRRHRIEHLEATSASDIPRFASLGVIASLQPAHARGMLNPNPTGGRITSIGAARHASGWPWKSIADAGGRIIFGSDWPVASLNPVGSFYVPITRAPRPGVADQRLSMTAVIDAYTKTGAWAEFEEAKKGALEAGKLADVVILSKDVFADPPTSADAVAVDTTVFNGQVVFSR
jgi:predicted amidohydrolase YtcJ